MPRRTLIPTGRGHFAVAVGHWLLGLAAFALVVLILDGCDRERDTIVVLVRHAEKAASPADDPPLTPAGVARAQELAAVLGRADVRAVFVTQYQRSRQTGAYLAAAAGLTPVTVPVGNDAVAHADTLAARILGNHAGEVVLVVGHSDTVPLIMEALGLASPPGLETSEFDHLFVLRRPPVGPARLVDARYGPGVPVSQALVGAPH